MAGPAVKISCSCEPFDGVELAAGVRDGIAVPLTKAASWTDFYFYRCAWALWVCQDRPFFQILEFWRFNSRCEDRTLSRHVA